MHNKTMSGFSLVELMVVLAIISLIAAIGGPVAYNMLQNARTRATEQTLRGVKSAIGFFNTDTMTYPSTLKDLVKRPTDEDVAASWGPEPYLKNEPTDSWGQKIIYKPTPEGDNPYELYSYGRNGKKAPKNEWINVWKLK